MSLGAQGAAAGSAMAWKMTGNDEIIAPVIEAYQRGEIPDDEAKLIADIAGLDPRQRGLIASTTNRMFGTGPADTPKERGLIARLTQGMGDGKPAIRPFDPEGSGYDYASAEKYGLKPGANKHWQSREPSTGLLLKGREHETWDLLEKGEEEAGYEIYKKDNRYYSRKKTPLVGDLTTDTKVPVLGTPDKDPADLEKAPKTTSGIDTDIIWDIESSKGTNMNSRAGAKGHHQFMPKTWPYVIKDMGKEGQEGWDWESGPMDYDKSTQASKHYFDVILPRELKAKGVPVNEKTLLAAYNAGAGTVSKTYKKHGAKWWEGHLPEETRNYIKKYEKRKNGKT